MENCAIKIIKKLSCCITGKSIRAPSQHQQQQKQRATAAAGWSAQQQQTGEQPQLLWQQTTTATRDHQPRPGAQSGTTTLKIKKLLVLQKKPEESPRNNSKDIVDYARSELVIDESQMCNDNESEVGGPGGKMVQLPEDQLLMSNRNSDSPSRRGSRSRRDGMVVISSADGGVNNMQGAVACVVGGGEERNVVEESIRSKEEEQEKQQTDDKKKDINFNATDIDRSLTIGDEMEEEEDPYAELDMYLEKVKVCILGGGQIFSIEGVEEYLWLLVKKGKE